MAIKSFVIGLFFLALLSLFSTIATKAVQKEAHEIPLITFVDSIMYTLNEEEVSQIVKSQTAIQYKQKDEMYDGIIVLRAKNEKEDIKDIIKANKIVKQGTLYSFYGDVQYDRDDFLSLRTQELFYDEATTVAHNSKPFTAVYYQDNLRGESLYLHQNKELFKASNTHFEIAVEQAQ
jgi:hypothetical protein